MGTGYHKDAVFGNCSEEPAGKIILFGFSGETDSTEKEYCLTCIKFGHILLNGAIPDR